MFYRITVFLIVVGFISAITGAAGAVAVDYFGYEEYGGMWCDAEKSPSNSEDDNLCWAAAASNILAWTGWGSPVSDDTDDIFAYFQGHWTDESGQMKNGWSWWFDGVDPGGSTAHVDVPGGGFWDPPYDYNDYKHYVWSDSLVMSGIDNDLHNGYGVTIGVYHGSIGHALTVWGIKYDDDTGDYLGVWVTDSDDNKNMPNPPDNLRYYDVEQDGDGVKWYLQDFYNTSGDYYIDNVQSLGHIPIPEPVTFILVTIGSLGMLGVARRRRK